MDVSRDRDHNLLIPTVLQFTHHSRPEPGSFAVLGAQGTPHPSPRGCTMWDAASRERREGHPPPPVPRAEAGANGRAAQAPTPLPRTENNPPPHLQPEGTTRELTPTPPRYTAVLHHKWCKPRRRQAEAYPPGPPPYSRLMKASASFSSGNCRSSALNSRECTHRRSPFIRTGCLRCSISW
jgi:hypothetical protein